LPYDLSWVGHALVSSSERRFLVLRLGRGIRIANGKILTSPKTTWDRVHIDDPPIVAVGNARNRLIRDKLVGNASSVSAPTTITGVEVRGRIAHARRRRRGVVNVE